MSANIDNEEMNTGMDDDLKELYILARYMYRNGTPILEDSTYDDLHELMVKSGELTEYTTRTHDDDPAPSADLLVKHGYINVQFDTAQKSTRDASFLTEDKSKSIKSVTEMELVYKFCQQFKGHDLCISVKMDGNNIKSEIQAGELKLSLTRGRASDGIDVTDAMERMMPEKIGIEGHRVLIGEVFLPSQHLDYIRKRYGGENKFKTPKSSAISLIRRPQDYAAEDYKLLDFRAFYCDGLSDTVTGMYEAIHEHGFNIAPYKKLENIPADYETFKEYMTNLMDEMYKEQASLGLPADGVVLELNDLLFETEIKDQYDERQIALKFGPWAPSTYTGRIKSIMVEQRRVMCSVRVEIKPLITDDSTTATVINVFNPSFLFQDELTEGSLIQFERVTGAVNVMVNGKKIKLKTGEIEADE